MKKIFFILITLFLPQLLRSQNLAQDPSVNIKDSTINVFDTTRPVFDSIPQSAFDSIPPQIIDTAQPVLKYSGELYPNIAGKSIMTPTAWGSYGKPYIFVFIGGAVPQVYSHKADLIASAGFEVGNAQKAVSFVGIVDINEVSMVSNFSYDGILSCNVGKASCISIGALHLFADPVRTDTKPSYYFAFSHAVQSIPSLTEGYSRLNYTIGMGTGRFVLKSKLDVETGKGTYGTAIFANVSYEVIKNVNVAVEWTGLNLCISAAWRPLSNLPAIGIGVTDLTRYSGDKAGFVFSIGHAFLLPSKNKQ